MLSDIKLANYQIDPVRGFLPAEDPLEQLPSYFTSWEDLAAQVSALLMTGRLRSALDQLPLLDTSRLEDDRQIQRAMLLLSVFGNAYVWAEKPAATSIPPGVAIPWAQVAEKLGRPLIVSNASLVLYNWRRLDKAGPLTLDNLDTLQLFLGGMDEKWFYLTAVAIEAKGVPALLALVEAQQAVTAGRVDDVARCLPTITAVTLDLVDVLRRIPEKCDPYIFYHRIRPFLAGWEAPGVVYEGVTDAPQILTGGSAAQSSLIQSLDAGLGVKHQSGETNPFLLEMRRYMPPAHRRFIEALEAGPSLQHFVRDHRQSHPVLADLYNDCIQALDDFRKKHMELTVRYILHQAPPGEEAKGTGGTSVVPFLSTAREETRAQIID
jgi:indoleamine 2,3-dioxygenase